MEHGHRDAWMGDIWFANACLGALGVSNQALDALLSLRASRAARHWDRRLGLADAAFRFSSAALSGQFLLVVVCWLSWAIFEIRGVGSSSK